jgi:hypothetical protein
MSSMEMSPAQQLPNGQKVNIVFAKAMPVARWGRAWLERGCADCRT